MAAPEPGAKVAKDQGIYLGQIYSYIKAGKVVNHKVGGYPEGKGVEVDPEEVAAARGSSKRKGGGPGKGKSGYVRKADRASRSSDDGPEPIKTRGSQGHKIGTIVSMAKAQLGTDVVARGPRYTIAQIIGRGGKLTYLDSGDRRVNYSGAVIDNIVIPTDKLGVSLAKGHAKIERPVNVLGMIILSFISEGKSDLAQSLENWLIKNKLEVLVPEPMAPDLADDEDEPTVGEEEE